MSLLGCDIPDNHRPESHSNFFSRGQGGKEDQGTMSAQGKIAGLPRRLGILLQEKFPALRQMQGARGGDTDSFVKLRDQGPR